MNKTITATLCLLCITASVSVSASSSLKLMPIKMGKVLGTIKLNHNGPAAGYHKITLNYTITDGNTQISGKSTLTGAYSTYFNTDYILDEPRDSEIEVITSATADITFETCTDKSYNSCSIIGHHNLKIDYTGNTITGIFPNNFNITV